MKKLLLILLSLCAMNSSFAQVNDGQVEHIMTERVLSCDDIYYNSMLLIPKLYRDNRTDTLEALVSYWNRNCGMNEASVAFSILYSIRNGNFREEIVNIYKNPAAGGRAEAAEYYRKNILSYLTENYNFYDIQHFKEKYPHYYYEAYVQYSNFIRGTAGSLIDKPGLTPVEKFLVEYYADPNPNRFPKLKDSVYNGTALQKAYTGERARFGGIDIGLRTGAWVPQGALSVLGSHPFVGFNIGGCSNRILYDIVVDFRIGPASAYYNVIYNDTLHETKDFTGYYLGLDMGYAFFRNRHHELALIGGIALDGIDVVANTNTSGTSNGQSVYSLNLNAGLGYKIFLSNKKTISAIKHSYLNLQVKYHAVNYNNPGGTDLTGNSITVGLTYGGYFKSYHKYYEK